MAEEGFKRKLAAILSADVEGYSRLMDDDEEATVRTLTAYRTAIKDLVQQYRGRVVDTTGDNLMAEFTSVVDAVNCAVEIQRELAERNAELPYNRKMEFRIGVNLGDVIEEEGRIYGDGVNIAARVESLSEAGGICISGRAYDQVANKLGLEYENLGEHQAKNISTPIRVYRVLSFPGAAAHRVVKAKKAVRKKWRIVAVVMVTSVVFCLVVAYFVWDIYFKLPTLDKAYAKETKFSLPEGPSIAVLPFVNMSEDPKQDYFSDGLTENIITGLSTIPKLFVIARNSVFTYKGKSVNIQQVAHDLGVNYVLEGGVQIANNHVRITVQLIDSTTGYHVWVEKYDRNLKDIFALQDEITIKIMTALGVKLTEGEQARLRFKGPLNLEAYMKALKAVEHFWRTNRDDNALARKRTKEVIDIVPDYAGAYVLLAMTHLQDLWYGSDYPIISFAKASKAVKEALALDDNSSDAYIALSHLSLMRKQHDNAIAAAERAVALCPSGADAYSTLGYVLFLSDRPKEATKFIEAAINLNPFPRSNYYVVLGEIYLAVEKNDMALAAFKKAVQIEYNDVWAHLGLVATYSILGREKEAIESAEEVLKLNPNLSIQKLEKVDPNKSRNTKKRYYGALRKLGLPE
jgi:TolB-like protein/class 3 adenylate cyclase